MWIRRRMNDDEVLKLAKNIVEEGFDYTHPCDFIGNYDSYLNEIIYGSAQTLINSFDELYKSDDDRHILESFVYKFIELKFGKYIKEVYDWYILHECGDSVNESVVTESKNFLRRRFLRFIEIVEEQIEGYEQNEDGAWWCRVYNPESFLENLIDRSIEIFIDENWHFFHDNSERGGSDMDISILNKTVEEEYGNYIKNLFVRKCGYNRY